MGKIVLPLACMLLSIGAYWPILDAYFLSDDFYLISELLRGSFPAIWAQEQGGFFRPLVALSLRSDLALWGLRPMGFHLSSLMLHGLCGYFVGLVANSFYRLPPSHHYGFQGIAAAVLFITSPVHTEPVCWISGRSEILFVLFSLAAIYAFAKFTTTRLLHWAYAVCACLLASLAAKETAFVTPAVLAIAALYHGHIKQQASPAHLASLLAAAAGTSLLFLILRWRMLGSVIGGYGAEIHLGWAKATILENSVKLLYRALMPAISIEAAPLIFLNFTVFTVISVSILLWRARQQDCSLLRPAMGLSACAVISIIPAMPMAIGIFDTLGERFVYMASAFACILISYILGLLFTRQRILLAAVCMLTIVQWSALQQVNQRWKHASYLSQAITRELAKIDASNALIVNIPDHMQGAYIFRNGIAEASTFFSGRPGSTGIAWLISHAIEPNDENYRVDCSNQLIRLFLPQGRKFSVSGGTFVQSSPSFDNKLLLTFRNSFPKTMRMYRFAGPKEQPILQELPACAED